MLKHVPPGEIGISSVSVLLITLGRSLSQFQRVTRPMRNATPKQDVNQSESKPISHRSVK